MNLRLKSCVLPRQLNLVRPSGPPPWQGCIIRQAGVHRVTTPEDGGSKTKEKEYDHHSVLKHTQVQPTITTKMACRKAIQWCILSHTGTFFVSQRWI